MNNGIMDFQYVRHTFCNQTKRMYISMICTLEEQTTSFNKTKKTHTHTLHI